METASSAYCRGARHLVGGSAGVLRKGAGAGGGNEFPCDRHSSGSPFSY
jgi:hypothetical protein